MNKQQFKQARLTLNLSRDKFAQELGLEGKHRGGWISKIENPELEHIKPSERLIKNAKILLDIHEMKEGLIGK